MNLNNWVNVFVDVIFILVTLFISVRISNKITEYLTKYLKNKTILLIIHLYIICILYFFARKITTNYVVDTQSATVFAGPTLGALSKFLVPFINYHVTFLNF
jgi:hypothetical protein